MSATSVSHAKSYQVGTPSGCEKYAPYKPSDDVEVKDGVDAKGWAVAPADLHPPVIGAEEFDRVDIPIDVPVKDYINDENYNVNLDETEIWAGRVQIGQDGSTRLNNTEIEDQPYYPECE